MAKTEEKKLSKQEQKIELQNFRSSEEGKKQISEIYANKADMILKAKEQIEKAKANERRK